MVDSIDALLGRGIGGSEADLQALADSLRGQQRAGDFMSLSTIGPISNLGKRQSAGVRADATRIGGLRQTMLKRAQDKANRIEDRDWKLSDDATQRGYTVSDAATQRGYTVEDDTRNRGYAVDDEASRRENALKVLKEGRVHDLNEQVEERDYAAQQLTKTLAREEAQRVADRAYDERNEYDTAQNQLAIDEQLARTEWNREQELARIKQADVLARDTAKSKAKIEQIKAKAAYKNPPASVRKARKEASAAIQEGRRAIDLINATPSVYDTLRSVSMGVSDWGPEMFSNAIESKAFTDKERATMAAGRNLYAIVRKERYGTALSAHEKKLGSQLDPMARGIDYKEAIIRINAIINVFEDTLDAEALTQDKDDTLRDLQSELADMNMQLEAAGDE